MPLQSFQPKKEEKFKREATVQAFPIPLMVYARVNRLATDHVGSSSNSSQKRKNTSSSSSSDTIKRVRKVFELAKHERMSEHEAKDALQLSAKMLSSANSKKSQVSLHKGGKECTQLVGHSSVEIRRKDGGDVESRQWTCDLASTIANAFNVKKFYMHRPQNSFEIVFYGLRDNTVAAAMSFEAVFNLALTWAAERKSKNCYLLGLSFSIYEMNEVDKKAEEEQAIENEKLLLKQTNLENKKKKRAQNTSISTKITGITNEEEDEITFLGVKRAQKSKSSLNSVKEEVKLEKIENTPNNKKRLDYDDEENEFVGWQSHTKLLKFRNMADRVADEYCTKMRWKFTDLITEKGKIQDHFTYQIGRKDARNVDLKRRRLEHA